MDKLTTNHEVHLVPHEGIWTATLIFIKEQRLVTVTSTKPAVALVLLWAKATELEMW